MANDYGLAPDAAVLARPDGSPSEHLRNCSAYDYSLIDFSLLLLHVPVPRSDWSSGALTSANQLFIERTVALA